MFVLYIAWRFRLFWLLLWLMWVWGDIGAGSKSISMIYSYTCYQLMTLFTSREQKKTANDRFIQKTDYHTRFFFAHLSFICSYINVCMYVQARDFRWLWIYSTDIPYSALLAASFHLSKEFSWFTHILSVHTYTYTCTHSYSYSRSKGQVQKEEKSHHCKHHRHFKWQFTLMASQWIENCHNNILLYMYECEEKDGDGI